MSSSVRMKKLLYACNRFWHSLKHIGMRHMRAIPGKAYVAEPIDDNQATGAIRPGREHGDSGLRGLARTVTACHKIGGTFGNEQTNEILSMASTRNSSVVIGIEATADERRVTHTSWILMRDATRRGGGCQFTGLVESHGPNRAVFFLLSL